MRHSVREYINHRRGAEWVATKVASALLILRKGQVGGGKKQGRKEGREEVRCGPSTERGRSPCSFLQTKFMCPPSSSYPAATVFAIRKRSSPLSLLSAACQKTKMLLLFSQVEKSRKSICLPVRQKNSPEAGGRERGRGGIIPCHATPSHLYLSPLPRPP